MVQVDNHVDISPAKWTAPPGTHSRNQPWRAPIEAGGEKRLASRSPVQHRRPALAAARGGAISVR